MLMEWWKKVLKILTVTCFSLVMASAAMGQEPQSMAADGPLRGKAMMPQDMLVRIAEIEVYPQYLSAYLDYARKVADVSVREEPGVICIFPMQLKHPDNVFRIVEIYRSEADYRHHLATPHFLQYKQGTLSMVKSLRLVDCGMVYPEGLPALFRKAVQD